MPSPAVLASKTVLLVEDDRDVRDEIAAALERAGYEVLQAADGREALELLRTTAPRPAAILLDWMMPVMDGMTFLTYQASDPRYASIPVIVVSAVAGMAQIPRLCVSEILAKPLRVRTLLDVVDRACRGGSRGGGGGGGGRTDDSPSGEWIGSPRDWAPQTRPGDDARSPCGAVTSCGSGSGWMSSARRRRRREAGAVAWMRARRSTPPPAE